LLIVPSTLDEILRQRFDELGVESTQLAWAEYLGKLDKGTLSRILSGGMPLTPRRARKWAGFLFDGLPSAAESFAQRMLDAAQQAVPTPSVSGFFENMVDRGGVVPADRILELLAALQAPGIDKVLICCEYRDLPRATPDSKYEDLAAPLGQAIANGVHFAMFQPFGVRIPLPREAGKEPAPALNAATYMLQVQTKCIDGYEAFRAEALKTKLKGDPDQAPKKFLAEARSLVSGRVNLYERKGHAYLGSGFQAKLFYIRYTTDDGDGSSTRHERIMQWVSTPKRDVLVYRGQREITPDAIRDSFYPVAHFFDAEGRLPNRGDGDVHVTLRAKPGGTGLPKTYDVWEPYA
jgi:hypothetical protein